MTQLLLLIGVGVLVAANGFFVAAEFALVRTRQGRIDQMRDEGLRGAALAARQVDQIDEYLSACQLGITMASLGIGFMGEPAIASLIEEPAWRVGLARGLAGHRAVLRLPDHHRPAHHPRRAGAQDLRHHPPRSGGPARRGTAAGIPGGPQAADLGAEQRIQRHPARDRRESEGRVRGGLRRRRPQDDHRPQPERGKLDPGEAGMLSGVFHLHEQEARQVMTPIPAVVTVDIAETAEAALRRCVDSGHTRLVVTEGGNTDRIRGIVHNNSLARRLMNEGPDASIESSVKDALIVPETKPLDDLLADLQRERASVAVVVDEYGRTAGIVSIEDIVEEVVGEIADETDPAVAGVRRLGNGDWWVRGHVPITDLADYGLDLPHESEAFNSVGGFVFGELGRLPKRGDMVRSNGYSLRVESVRENRIEAVRIRDHGRGASNDPVAEPEPREAAEGA
ncbi:MAG: hemolysin family protein [Thermoleophilaceae bacterium]